MSGGRTALVLSGGGARGAYQAGVLRGLVDLGVICGPRAFPIVVGASAGALNAGAVASYADRLAEGVSVLGGLWGNVRADQVFRTDLRALSNVGARWMRDLSFGGLLGHTSPKSLLDTAPLRAWLSGAIPIGRVSGHVQSGALDALAVLATDLNTAEGVVFLEARANTPGWERSRWRLERTRIGIEHLVASSAIPIFFPSVEIDGRYYGDGSIRNTAPLSPAIRLGADRVVAVGVRRALQRTGPVHAGAPTIAQVASTLLDAVMLDAVETDVEHSERLNVGIHDCVQRGVARVEGLRPVEVLWLTPSTSIRAIAAEHMDAIPGLVRYLLHGLGDDEAITELASYLLFDASFCRRLLDLGRADLMSREAEVRAFFGSRSGEQ